jgi:hypothetical protein
VVAAAGLFWIELWADLIGWAAFVVVVLLQKFYDPWVKREGFNKRDTSLSV